MPFLGMPSKVRNDPLGPSSLGLLKNNADLLRRFALFEHIQSSGEHNAREIPRVVRRISGTTVSPSSTDITSVTNPSAGRYVINLAANRFDADFIACQINPCGADVANKPYLVGYQVISSTQIEVYLKQLTADLGFDPAGNVWSAGTDLDFDIAIHSNPLAAGSWPTALPADTISGDTFKPTRWNALVKNAADLYKVLDAEHDPSTGAHTTRQIASRSGLWRYDGTNVTLIAGSASGITVSRSSTGIYAISSSSALTAQTHCFVSPEYRRNYGGDASTMYRMHVLQNSTTSWTLYSYSFNRTNETWNRADGDFWLAMHSG